MIKKLKFKFSRKYREAIAFQAAAFLREKGKDVTPYCGVYGTNWFVRSTPKLISSDLLNCGNDEHLILLAELEGFKY